MRNDRDQETGIENFENNPYCERNDDPRDQVVRLEALIEQLKAKIESCRKFILASRIAAWGGGVVLFAMLFGLLRFDAGIMSGAIAGLLRDASRRPGPSRRPW
jgi:hypothetical protein